MTRRVIITRPAPPQDRPRPWTVGLAAGLGLAIGLSLAAWSLDVRLVDRAANDVEEVPMPGPAHVEGEPAPDANEPAVEDAAVEQPEQLEVVELEDAAVEEASEVTSLAEPVPTIDPGDRTMRRGRLAYIRCEGQTPCPRDRALESAVWVALASLPSCARGPRGAGHADLRLHFSDAAPTIRFRDAPGPGPLLDYGQILSCLEAPLGAQRSMLRRPFVVSFRFSLSE